ncbi:type II toxin-antitoxin system RelE/ParE family toxin [Mesorhizobium sp. VK25A]|uniref:Type II toxin-antitoxin system RelE/ParE family toxin n=1 Tax=Mesorhizobium vachelliae TaxID=3072309 RepID=A0ABU5AB31_9HYPH|nr:MULTISPECIES: type II toxin-antitoxin system RelE/ParE family toxin [unclassified Mesorhizobium]MDX8534929.1 type II toxin-antitoxin system RelE/ParE family toxin [Mesorhizobium sp. VK25D]MDX8547519.1 type II toxin-antitoxin system RelE/ParE family toxin [Mesorhizobium sp. VK25A]
MLRIVRTAHAEEDLIAIWQYVARDSEVAADRLPDRIERRWRQLAVYPSSGPIRDDIAPGIRHLVVGEYLSLPCSRGCDRILRVLHGRRKIEADDLI